MTTLDLARLQFGLVTVFHFLIVPTSIGLGFFTAYLQAFTHRALISAAINLDRALDADRQAFAIRKEAA
jgi:cytochrome d ubiquinol oxidase subunit I